MKIGLLLEALPPEPQLLLVKLSFLFIFPYKHTWAGGNGGKGPPGPTR